MKFLLVEHNKIVMAIQAHQIDELKKLFAGNASDTYFSLLEGWSKLEEVNRNGGAATVSSANAIFDQSRLWIMVLLIGSLLIGLELAVLVARTISQSLKAAVAVADLVASGDLTREIAVTRRDETGQLMASLRKMNDGLHAMVSRVGIGAEAIATASSQISTGNRDLLIRTEEQAGSLEETAAAMEEMTSTVKHNSDNARQANQLAETASIIARDGGHLVD